ncbi:unnamed protein product, partial [Rotaria magnacalcarata]
ISGAAYLRGTTTSVVDAVLPTKEYNVLARVKPKSVNLTKFSCGLEL